MQINSPRRQRILGEHTETWTKPNFDISLLEEFTLKERKPLPPPLLRKDFGIGRREQL